MNWLLCRVIVIRMVLKLYLDFKSVIGINIFYIRGSIWFEVRLFVFYILFVEIFIGK